jgi:hypothetical protein
MAAAALEMVALAPQRPTHRFAARQSVIHNALVEKARRGALWAFALANAAAAWFPFTLDLPVRVTNTAAQGLSGGWRVDADSRVSMENPSPAAVEMTRQRYFEFSVVATPGLPDLSGPARVFSIGRDPYQPALMLAVDGTEFVVRLPCIGPAGAVANAEWRSPLQAGERLVQAVRFQPSAAGIEAVSSSPINESLRSVRKCPAGTAAGAPDSHVPWTIGNVASGHRPFVGLISELVIDDGRHRLDLLRQLRWQTPAVYWRWPERWLQRADGWQLLPTAWHFASFVPLGYLWSAAGRSTTVMRTLTPVACFAALLNAVKLFVAGRHVSLIDVVVNVAGAAAGCWLWLRVGNSNRSLGK